MESKSDTPIVELRSASLAYGSVMALHNVDLAIYPGEIHAVVGEHGAGKSSLGQILSGLTPLHLGELRIEGQCPLRYNSRKALSEGIIMVRQNTSIFKHRSVLENIYVAGTSFRKGLLTNKDKIRRDIGTMLSRHGVSLDLNAPVGELKLADQVLLEIMRSLSISPRLLILDEALEKLTSRSLGQIVDLLRNHANSGHSVLFITHRIDDIFRLADRVSVIRKGELLLTEPIGSMDKFSLIKMAYTQYPVPGDEEPLDREFYHLLKYNQAILESLPVNLLAINNDNKIKLINAQALNFFDRDLNAVRGMDIREFLGDETELLSAIQTGVSKDCITTVYHKVVMTQDGLRIVNITIIPIRDETWPIGSLLMIEDATEQEELRDMVHFSDKLASVGLLATGVAHEINNPMEIILNNVEYLESLYKDQIDVEILNEISEEINAISDIVGTLSLAGDEVDFNAELIHPKVVIESVTALLMNFAGDRGIGIRFDMEAGDVRIRAHQGELRQIILNLVKNSIEAMPAGGDIHIRLTSTGEMIDMTVTDTGPGIDPENRKNIFLPFFTTKDGEETNRGLGLYMAYKLVKKNNGLIRLDHDHAEGCRIILSFPAQSTLLPISEQ